MYTIYPGAAATTSCKRAELLSPVIEISRQVSSPPRFLSIVSFPPQPLSFLELAQSLYQPTRRFYVSQIMTTIHLSPYNSLSAGSGSASAVESINGSSSTCINPAQVNGHAHSAPPSTNGSTKKKSISGNKRKRTDSGCVDDQRKNRDGPRKKKANRACYHCQKAHLTCDDSTCCARSFPGRHFTVALQLGRVSVV